MVEWTSVYRLAAGAAGAASAGAMLRHAAAVTSKSETAVATVGHLQRAQSCCLFPACHLAA